MYKNFNKKDTYLISTTLFYISFSSPRTKELSQNWVKFFSFAAVKCRYILLTTIENLIYLSTFDSGTVSFYTPSHSNYQLHLHEKNTKQKSCSTIPKNKGAFVTVTFALVDFHYWHWLWSFKFLHSKINQNIITVLQIYPFLERIKNLQKISI